MGNFTYIVTDAQHAAFRQKLIDQGVLTPGVPFGPGRPYLTPRMLQAKKAYLAKHGLLVQGGGRSKLEFDDGWVTA